MHVRPCWQPAVDVQAAPIFAVPDAMQRTLPLSSARSHVSAGPQPHCGMSPHTRFGGVRLHVSRASREEPSVPVEMGASWFAVDASGVPSVVVGPGASGPSSAGARGAADEHAATTKAVTARCLRKTMYLTT